MEYLTSIALRNIAALLAVLLFAGCQIAPDLPPEIAVISLNKIDSDRITVQKVWLRQENGKLFLRGRVVRHYPRSRDDTAGTHLLIKLFDAKGGCLWSFPAEFEPRHIPDGVRGSSYFIPGHSFFSLPLEELPVGTIRIQIQAYDDIISISMLSAHRPLSRCDNY